MIKAHTSATISAIQMPFIPHSNGNTKTAAHWKTSVLKKEMSAETKPLFNAVKKEEVERFAPIKRYAGE